MSLLVTPNLDNPFADLPVQNGPQLISPICTSSPNFLCSLPFQAVPPPSGLRLGWRTRRGRVTDIAWNGATIFRHTALLLELILSPPSAKGPGTDLQLPTTSQVQIRQIAFALSEEGTRALPW